MSQIPEKHRARVATELADSFDEEFELELDDERLDDLLAETADHRKPEGMDRQDISASCFGYKAS